MTFFNFPREIRDLIYSFILPSDQTINVHCTKNESLPRSTQMQSIPQILWRTTGCRTELGILHASKRTQYECLERVCAINVFIFSAPRQKGLWAHWTQPISQIHAKLLQRIEIHMDVGDFMFGALDMLGRNNIVRRFCRLVLENVNMLDFRFIEHGLIHVMMFLQEFETVVVVQKFEFMFGAIYSNAGFRSCMACSLGPSYVYEEGAVVCHEFYPRDYMVNR